MKPKLAITVAAAAIGALALLPSSAGAYSAGCASDPESGGASFTADSGEVDNVSIGTNADGSATGLAYQGTLKDGTPFSSSFACETEGSRFKTAAVFLGDGDDIGRTDGKGFTGDSGLGPLNKSIDVIIRGGGGDDRLIGSPGGGSLRAGNGDDIIRDTGGHDVIRAGSGDDVINARDGLRDLIDCGSGDDKVKADPFDTLHNCGGGGR